MLVRGYLKRCYFQNHFFLFSDNSMDKIPLLKIIKALERKLNIINLIQFLHIFQIV